MTQQLTLLERLHAERKIARPQCARAQRTSKLFRHHQTIVELQHSGATLGDIQHYLRAIAKPPVPVARSTILRYLKKARS